MESLSQEINFSSHSISFFPFFFYFHTGSARQTAWFTVDVIKQLTGWYLRPLSEKKQKPRFFFFIIIMCADFFFSVPIHHSSSIVQYFCHETEFRSIGLLIRLKVKTLISVHSAEQTVGRKSNLDQKKS